MKKINLLFTMLMLAMTACVFTACGDDDEDNGGGSGSENGVISVTDGTSKSGLNNGMYYFMVERGQQSSTGLEVYCYLQFYTFDYYTAFKNQDASAIPSMFSYVYIVFLAGYEEMSEIPVGTFPLEAMDICIDVPKPTEGEETTAQNYYEYADKDYTAKVQITKSGNQYTLKLENAKVTDTDYYDYGDKLASFSYTGQINLIPDESLKVE